MKLLVEPPRIDRPRKHAHFGKPAERVLRTSVEGGRPSRKFFLLIEPTKPLIDLGASPDEKPKSQVELQSALLKPTQARLYSILNIELGYAASKIAIKAERAKIIHTDSRNGVQGWYVPLFRVGEVYIELTMGTDTIAASHRVAFLRQYYGKSIVHLSAENFYQVRDRPELLRELMAQAMDEQIPAERYERKPNSTKRAKKPKKGRRGIKSSRPNSKRPSRDIERQASRRAARKLARDLVKAENKAARRRRICILTSAEVKTSSSFKPSVAVRKGPGPMPAGVKRTNTGPLGSNKAKPTAWLPIAA